MLNLAFSMDSQEAMRILSHGYRVEYSWMIEEGKAYSLEGGFQLPPRVLLLHPKDFVQLCIALKDWDGALNMQKQINHVNIKQQGWTFNAIRLDTLMQMRINNCLAFKTKCDYEEFIEQLNQQGR
jgi:hypothetical protein